MDNTIEINLTDANEHGAFDEPSYARRSGLAGTKARAAAFCYRNRQYLTKLAAQTVAAQQAETRTEHNDD